MPELSVLLEENFVQDEKGRWYIRIPPKKAMWPNCVRKAVEEFEGYKIPGQAETVPFGSYLCRLLSPLEDKNYQAIVTIAGPPEDHSGGRKPVDVLRYQLKQSINKKVQNAKYRRFRF